MLSFTYTAFCDFCDRIILRADLSPDWNNITIFCKILTSSAKFGFCKRFKSSASDYVYKYCHCSEANHYSLFLLTTWRSNCATGLLAKLVIYYVKLQILKSQMCLTVVQCLSWGEKGNKSGRTQMQMKEAELSEVFFVNCMNWPLKPCKIVFFVKYLKNMRFITIN